MDRTYPYARRQNAALALDMGLAWVVLCALIGVLLAIVFALMTQTPAQIADDAARLIAPVADTLDALAVRVLK